MNLVFLEGNLTREPDARVNDFGSTTWSSTLAVPEVRWDSKASQEAIHTNWIFLTARMDVADQLVAANLTKSCKVAIRGKIGTYVKEVNGVKETKTQVEVTGFDVIRRPMSSGNFNNSNEGWNASPQGNAGGWGSPPQQSQPQQGGGDWGNPPQSQQAPQQAPQQAQPQQAQPQQGGGWTNGPEWGQQ